MRFNMSKKAKKLDGREVHDVPNSFLNKPKPSDTPTKVLASEEIETPVISSNPNPGTTVLGMDFEDFESNNEPTSEPEPKPIPKTNDKPKIEEKNKTEVKPVPKPKKKTVDKKQGTTPRYSKFVLVRKLDGEVVKISKKDFVIGKSKFSDYQVTKNNTVSRSHVIAHKQTDGSLTIEDNDSKNGTFVDGERLEPHEIIELKDGMSLRLSDEIFEVRKA